MFIHITRFTSALPPGGVEQVFAERLGHYASVPGLQQKYYLRFPETGEFGGIYVWDGAASMRAFLDTDLSRSIREAYQVRESRRDEADVVLTLHTSEGATGNTG